MAAAGILPPADGLKVKLTDELLRAGPSSAVVCLLVTLSYLLTNCFWNLSGWARTSVLAADRDGIFSQLDVDGRMERIVPDPFLTAVT